MLFDAIKESNNYKLDYVEINDVNIDELYQGKMVTNNPNILTVYDFYIFNYHNLTMRDIEKIDSKYFLNLPGRTFCVILEMNRNDPFPYMNPTGFTDLLVLDPTMDRPESNIHAFPRPLKQSKNVRKIKSLPEVPIIGSFGYAHPGKGFDLVVKAVVNEFERANIRINLSPSTYADAWFGEQYKKQIEAECKSYERDGIEVEFTYHYFSDNELIDWCRENTLNCFFYNRNSPGLAAATDQAVLSGAPLAVSENTTFRHIHTYIKPYPQFSLKESILESQDGIVKMQDDWSSGMCVAKLEQILSK